MFIIDLDIAREFLYFKPYHNLTTVLKRINKNPLEIEKRAQNKSKNIRK